MSTLHHPIEISGWRAAWLDRTYSPLQTYTAVASCALAVCICALGLVGFFGVRKGTKQLNDATTERAVIFKKINKRIIKVCKGHWVVANLYLLNALMFGIGDGIIGAMSIKDAVADDPEVVTNQFIFEMVAYCGYVFVLFTTVLTVFPLLQVICATWALNRFASKRGITGLSEYLPEARMYSTHIAQLWAMVTFFMMASWPATDNSGSQWFPLRWVLLEACVGSSLLWLDASFAFNFSYKRLADSDIEFTCGTATEIVRMFGKTMKTAHNWDEKKALPRYEDNEKTPLVLVEVEG